MTATVDPTYPLYPVVCIIAAVMLLCVLLTSFIRQSWNLGVVFLCFWLFFENLAGAINALIWADNADIKLYVYCDIVSHLGMITSVVKPMATLIITRRLYTIVNLQSVTPPDKAARAWDRAIEWTLGLVIPLLVAGPLYYVVQGYRFQVLEGFGCQNAPDGSILAVLLINSWDIIPPLISTVFYFPRVARIFYRQSRDVNHFLHSNDSVSRTNYFRILVLASIDILLTLPIGIATITLFLVGQKNTGFLRFYNGFTFDHTAWGPHRVSFAEIVHLGAFNVGQLYFIHWTSPILAFAIFGLFGITPEARASYWRLICVVCGWFGWEPTPKTRTASAQLGEMRFGERPRRQDISLTFDLESQPSVLDGPHTRDNEHEKEKTNSNSATNEIEFGKDKEDQGSTSSPTEHSRA
ncbi:unnamed protein product [Peniophora sp. CBMAI 1063]|nr:unnamed protein product [Peniophora sp. CBMAI 1063]